MCVIFYAKNSGKFWGHQKRGKVDVISWIFPNRWVSDIRLIKYLHM